MVRVCFLSGVKEIVGHQEIQLPHCGELSELLEELCNRYGQGLRCVLFESPGQGQRNPWVKILVNGDDIKGKDPRLAGDETIVLFLPIAGG